MKKHFLAMMALGISLPFAGAAEPAIGEIIDGTGKIFANDHGMVVRKILKAGEDIKPHNHEGEEIFFAVMRGEIKVMLDDKAEFTLKGGDVLRFDGKHVISAKATSDTVIVVNLIKH